MRRPRAAALPIFRLTFAIAHAIALALNGCSSPPLPAPPAPPQALTPHALPCGYRVVSRAQFALAVPALWEDLAPRDALYRARGALHTDVSIAALPASDLAARATTLAADAHVARVGATLDGVPPARRAGAFIARDAARVTWVALVTGAASGAAGYELRCTFDAVDEATRADVCRAVLGSLVVL